MSAHDNKELIEYEDERAVVPTALSSTNGGTRADEDDKCKKKFTGIHETGFR